LPPVILIGGPTASGKSALALRLAERIGAEIVNADALQLYRDLCILSARPSPEEAARAPHHLFGHVDAAEGWSVGRWLTAASQTLAAVAARGRPAVVVGGTGLYFRALTHGLAEIPPVPAASRREAREVLDRLGEAGFREALAKHDPKAAARIAPGDRQRLTRAWEVFDATGRSLSDWQADTAPTLRQGAWSAIALEPPRAELYARCDLRFTAMMRAGALEEVRMLIARGLDPELPAMKAVGVRELAARLRGELSEAAAVAFAQQETRRYAKRQMTWFRRQASDWLRILESNPQEQWSDLIGKNRALNLNLT
jgi:tRNA dimethylallyltransferase